MDTSNRDLLILVDDADREIGYLGKEPCHDGEGILHRAFSVLIYNDRGELLLQQRSAAKRLWPLYWSNSCCSHPRMGESMEAASKRRLYEELGLSCPLRFLFKFQYQAQFAAIGAERELCSVFIGRCNEELRVDSNEISSWRWIGPEALAAEMTTTRARLTPWFRAWNGNASSAIISRTFWRCGPNRRRRPAHTLSKGRIWEFR